MKITADNASEVIAKLSEPFDPKDIEWRLGQVNVRDGQVSSAIAFAYITRTAVLRRLDEVLGPHNWRVEYREWHPERKDNEIAQLCGISVKIDGEWITKWDAAADTDFEGVKGGISDALKRAATCWGIGRYLYDLPEGWVRIVERGTPGALYGRHDDKKTGRSYTFYWVPPKLPPAALPAGYIPAEKMGRQSPSDRRQRTAEPSEQPRDVELARLETARMLEILEKNNADISEYRSLYASLNSASFASWSDEAKAVAREMIEDAAKKASTATTAA